MTTPSEAGTQQTFEQSLDSLEAIVHDLEGGQTGLAESLAKYEQGVRLLKQCYEMLQKAERRIELLTKIDMSGEVVTEPFDDSPTAGSPSGEAATTSRRSKRRSAKPAQKNPAEEQSGESGEIDVPGGLF